LIQSLYSISAFLKQKIDDHSNMRQELQEAHKSLRKDNSTVITTPDKGNGVVIPNRTEYVSKMEDIFRDCLSKEILSQKRIRH